MNFVKFIGIRAVGVEDNGEQYDCDVIISFPARTNINPSEINSVVNEQIEKLKIQHPTSKILKIVETVKIVI